jgi:Meiotically Up-regulated Gene 113 (MUG113) protein
MVDLALRMSARWGRWSRAELEKQLADDPQPTSKPIKCVSSLQIANIVVPPLGQNYYGHVYVIGFADYVKIGWSENVKRRLFDIQKHAPEKLVLYSVFATQEATERKLHRRFKRLRLHGEWFALTHSLKDWVRNGCPMENADGRSAP